MSARVRTANVDAQIKARSRAGLSARQIAKELGLSRASVDRSLAAAPPVAVKVAPKRKRPTPSQPPAPPAAKPELEAADIDELRVVMSDLARGLSGLAREAHKTGDVGSYAALASKAQGAVLALAKLSPAAPEAEQEGSYITHADMAKAAAKARAAILERVARRARGDA